MVNKGARGAGYIRICNRMFCQNSHIAHFSAYNGIFKIAYVKIMLHMLHITKFAYVRTYAAYFRK